MIEVIALAGAFTHAGENAKATMTFSDIVDEFLDDNGLADTGATESSNFTAFHEGADEVNNFDTGFKDLNLFSLIFQGRCLAMNRPTRRIRATRLIVIGLTRTVEDP